MRLPPVEAGALFLFLVALAITASFFAPPGSSAEPPGVSLGLAPGGAQLAPRPLVPPDRWFVRYYEELDGVRDPVARREGLVPELDQVFPAGPFGDIADNAWGLSAEMSLDLPRGEYFFTLEHDGAIEVWVNDRLIAEDTDPSALVRREFTFKHQGGALAMRLEGHDREGPFVMRWVR